MSRLTSLFDDSNRNGVLDTGGNPPETVESAYKYLGLGQIVEEDDLGAKMTYLNSSGNVTGLDRFGLTLCRSGLQTNHREPRIGTPWDELQNLRPSLSSHPLPTATASWWPISCS
jgi:hypothetical protein